MPVAEAQARITEAEFVDWMHYFADKLETHRRLAKGERPITPEESEDMSAEETITYMHAIMAQIAPRT